MIVTVAAPTNAVLMGYPSSSSTAGIERQVSILGGGQHTYAVSGLGSTIDDYTRLLPRSTIGEGLAVRGEQAGDARADVEAWLRRIGLLSP